LSDGLGDTDEQFTPEAFLSAALVEGEYVRRPLMPKMALVQESRLARGDEMDRHVCTEPMLFQHPLGHTADGGAIDGSVALAIEDRQDSLGPYHATEADRGAEAGGSARCCS